MPLVVPSPAGRLVQVASSQLGLVTRQQAVREAGCSDKVLASLCRTGQIERIRRGVYRWRTSPRSFEQDALAACLATSNSAACSVTAMRLYGYDARFFRRLGRKGRDLHVVALFGRDQPVQRGVRVHRTRLLHPRERTMRRGVPVTSPIRTLKDVAHLVTTSELEGFVGHLLATRAVTAKELGSLHRELGTRGGSGRHGSSKLRRCLISAGVSNQPESVLEHRVLLLLREAGLPEPAAQFPIYDTAGRFVARVDNAFVEAKVILEVDGYRWHSSPAAFRADRRKANQLELLGFMLFRVTAAEVSEGMADVIAQLRSALRRGRRGRAAEDNGPVCGWSALDCVAS
jgi:very-short-patch-repair endonuclease